jgi:hypothetical protein
MMKSAFPVFFLLTVLFSCTTARKNYNPDQRFGRKALDADYVLLRNILEAKHPALYWYTPKARMDFYFDSLRNQIADSMTAQQFGWQVLAPLLQKIRCGHTSFSMDNQWRKFIRNKQIPGFPLQVKTWGDTMIVTANLNKKDSLIRSGMRITSINHIPVRELQENMFRYLPTDGYAHNINFSRLSANFPYYHRNIYGIFKNYRVGISDSSGEEKKYLIPLWSPEADSTEKKGTGKGPTVKMSAKEKRQLKRDRYRRFGIDSVQNYAALTLNTFNNGRFKRLRRFFRSSFRELEKNRIENLVIDLRNNGGGNIDLYVLLAKYIKDSAFRVSDSTYARAKSLSPYTRHIRHGWINNIGLLFLTKKNREGQYRLGHYERHYYRPKKKNHFNGQVYVLTAGPTFSASTLFCHAVKGQKNVLLVGEETGGGWHGNSGVMIPDIRLPQTKLLVRLPLFKIVQFNHVAHTGTGVIPDILIPPTAEGVTKRIDRKMVFVKELIRRNKGLHQGSM